MTGSPKAENAVSRSPRQALHRAVAFVAGYSPSPALHAPGEGIGFQIEHVVELHEPDRPLHNTGQSFEFVGRGSSRILFGAHGPGYGLQCFPMLPPGRLSLGHRGQPGHAVFRNMRDRRGGYSDHAGCQSGSNDRLESSARSCRYPGAANRQAGRGKFVGQSGSPCLENALDRSTGNAMVAVVFVDYLPSAPRFSKRRQRQLAAFPFLLRLCPSAESGNRKDVPKGEQKPRGDGRNGRSQTPCLCGDRQRLPRGDRAPDRPEQGLCLADRQPPLPASSAGPAPWTRPAGGPGPVRRQQCATAPLSLA